MSEPLFLTFTPQPKSEEKVEVIKIVGNDVCFVANGTLIYQYSECKPKQYQLPKDYNLLINK